MQHLKGAIPGIRDFSLTSGNLLSNGMDILYVGTLLPHEGGSGITSSLLLKGLVKLGHGVRAVAPIVAGVASREDPLRSWCPEIEVQRYQVPHYATDEVHTPVQPAYRDEERRQIRTHLLRLSKEKRADLILVGKETFVHEIPKISQRLGLPWVLRLGGHVLMGLGEGHLSGEAEELRRCFQAADLVVAQAEHLRLPAERFGCRKIAVVPNTVDLDQFAPRPKSAQLCRALGIGADDIVVMHVSNLKPVKRAADMIESAPAVLAADPRIRYVIVGDGPCRPALERMVIDKRLQERFRFTGWMDYEQMPEYLAVADLVVMASEREQQARVYLETQAMERVLIASDIAAARTAVEHEATGLLFPMGDVNALTCEILRAAANPGLRREIGKGARKSVAKFSIHEISIQFAHQMAAVVRKRGEG